MLSFAVRGFFSHFRLRGTCELRACTLQYGARLDPGRARWRVLWASEVARAGSFSWGFIPAEPCRTMQTPKCHFVLFCFSLRCCVWCKDHMSPQKLHTLKQPRYYNSRARFKRFHCDSHERCFFGRRKCRLHAASPTRQPELSA